MTDESPQALLHQALQKHQAGDLAGAAPLYQQVLKANPQDPDALHLLGFLLHQAGKPAEGLKLVDAAIAIVPQQASFRSNRARILQRLGHQTEADTAFRMALALNPSDAGAFRELAEARRANGQVLAAAPLFRRLLSFSPADPVALLAEATSRIDLGHYDAARHLLRKCLLVAPALIEATNSYAFLGITALTFVEARRWFMRTITTQPRYAAPYSGLAEITYFEGDVTGSLGFSEQAVALTPDDPQIRVRHGMRLLSIGRIQEGWQNFEWRLKRPDAVQRVGLPSRWQGEPLSGKRILVCAEEGVGDEILYASLIPDLLSAGASVVIECAPRLVEVFRRSFPDCLVHAYARSGDRFRPVHEYNWLPQDPPVDYAIDGGSLPARLRPELASYDHQRPYLSASPERVRRMAEKLAALPPGPRIGFAWRSKIGDPFRNLFNTQLDDWRDLLTDPKLQIVSLQYGTGWEQEIAEARQAFGARLHVLDGVDMTNDFEDIFALAASVDSLVCPSSTLVWVGAGLDKPVLQFALRPYFPQFGTDISPGFPTVKSFLKLAAEPWNHVTDEITASVRNL
ncbi:tetratricopeptide repeat protein [Nisaea denitrificans]|uniref:tetratricopeptide repeat-containing glycosyltransferase family protein n=1 Tax=Nisaea denitrificans TaxID=390877 RepID=UPI00040165DB|nr:tetratricopeptide repeat protein [Nisaea denitrificans]